MQNFNLFIPLTKVDEAQRLVYGLATAEQLDKSGEIFDYETSLPYYKEWSGEIQKASGGKSLGNVREMHTNIAAGKLTQINFNDDAKQIEVCAKIVNDSTWEKIMEGVLTGFSHGGEYIKTWKDPDNTKVTRYTARPSELSVVDNPCLGTATFELLRSDGATEMRKFKNQETPMTATVVDGKPVQPKYKPIQKWVASDGTAFDKKEEWRVYEIELEAKTPINPAFQALADLTKAIEEKELQKKEFSDEERKKLADSGAALPDGSFPIETKQDLKNAIRAYGRAADKEKAKAHIEARAKTLGAEDMLPDGWDTKASEKAQAAANLKKSFAEAYDAKSAIEALCIIECLISGEEWEEMMGDGEDGQVADLKEAVSRIKSFIAAEIMEGEAEKLDQADLQKAGARHSSSDKGHLSKAMEQLGEAKDHQEDATKAHGKVADAHDGMRKCMGKMTDCMKAISSGDLAKAQEEQGNISDHMDEMEGHMDKAEKHHSKVTKAHDGMAAAHDAIGHSLKAVGAMDGEKVESPEMQKMETANQELQTEKAALQEQNAVLQKSLDQFNQEIPQMLAPLVERIKKLEAQPLPAKGALYDVQLAGPVKKGHEATVPAQPVETPPVNRGLSPEAQRRHLGIK